MQTVHQDTSSIFESPNDHFKEMAIRDTMFKTSLSIIKEVMNVPVPALKSILRQNGYDDSIDLPSICIDEEMLEIFADAYIRKMKSYYTQSLRHVEMLSLEELRDLKKFYNHFKTERAHSGLANWSTIDVQELRKAFFRNVKNKTAEKERSKNKPLYQFLERLHKVLGYNKGEVLDYNLNIHSYFSYEKIKEPISLHLNETEQEYDREEYKEVNNTLRRITHNRFYLTVYKPKIIYHSFYPISQYFRSLYLSSRYYIYPEEDSDHNIIINSAS